MMKSRRFMLAYRLILALALIAFGANSLWKKHRLDQEGVPARGTITQFISGKNSRYVFWFPVGKETFWGRSSGNFTVGQTLEVKYLPSDPREYEVTGTDEINPGWLFCGFGLFFAAMSVFLYQRSTRFKVENPI
jgi:hypothetical protein